MAFLAKQLSSLRALANHRANSKYQFEIPSQNMTIFKPEHRKSIIDSREKTINKNRRGFLYKSQF